MHTINKFLTILDHDFFFIRRIKAYDPASRNNSVDSHCSSVAPISNLSSSSNASLEVPPANDVINAGDNVRKRLVSDLESSLVRFLWSDGGKREDLAPGDGNKEKRR